MLEEERMGKLTCSSCCPPLSPSLNNCKSLFQFSCKKEPSASLSHSPSSQSFQSKKKQTNKELNKIFEKEFSSTQAAKEMYICRGTCNCSLIDGTNLYKLLCADLDDPCLEWKTLSTFLIRLISSVDDVNMLKTCVR